MNGQETNSHDPHTPLTPEEAQSILDEYDAMSEIDRLKPGVTTRVLEAEDVLFPEKKKVLDDRKARANSLLKEGQFTVTSAGVVIINEAVEESPLLFAAVMENKLRETTADQ